MINSASEKTASRFTPGPWTSTKDSFETFIIGSNGNIVARGFFGSAKDVPLLTTAPELLEALKEIVNKLDEMAPTELNHRVPYTEYSRISKAKKAIAKAEGKN